MMAKWASGKHEVFIDVNKLPLYPKLCKPVAQQSRTESRRLWKNVTYNLKVIIQNFSAKLTFGINLEIFLIGLMTLFTHPIGK